MTSIDVDVRGKNPYPRFMILWAGQLMSSLGNGMTAFALGVYVFQQTGSAASFAMVSFCLFIPSILLKPLGGVLADRFDRRALIIGGDLGSALAVLFLLGASFHGSLALWKIYLGVSVNSIFTALQGPAYKASVTDLLEEKQYARAGGLVQLASSAQHLLSPAAAGFILSFGTLSAILFIDLSTFLIAVVAVLTIRRPCGGKLADGNQSFAEDLREGWNTVISDRRILPVVLLISMITFFVGSLQILFAPMLLPTTDAKTLGLAQSVSAAGMLLSSLLLGVFGIRGKNATSLLISLAGAGICMACMGVTPHIGFITVAFFLFFCALPVINTSADVIIRRAVPNDRQGRAWGIIGLLSQIGYIGAYLSSGILADRFFKPLLMQNGSLASSVGRLIGTGPGRGIGFMLILAGLLTVLISFAAAGPLLRIEKE